MQKENPKKMGISIGNDIDEKIELHYTQIKQKKKRELKV
jgi:hypothetical protein